MFISAPPADPPAAHVTDAIVGNLHAIVSCLLQFIAESSALYLAVPLEGTMKSSRSIPQLAQVVETAWLNLDGEEEENVYSKKHLVWLVCLVTITELSRDSVLNFHGGGILLLNAVTELMQVLSVPEGLWATNAMEVESLLEQHAEELQKIHADKEASAAGLIRIPRAASHAIGLWPQRQFTGRQASALSAALFVPGGLTLAASIIGTAMLVNAGRMGYERSQEVAANKTRLEAIEERCLCKAQNLLRRKVSPIRLTNTLVLAEHPDTLKICLYSDKDFLELVPVGGKNGSGVAYCNKGCEVALRPPVTAVNEVFKLKVFRPRMFINEPLITIMGVRRGDKLILASGHLKPGEIIVQRI